MGAHRSTLATRAATLTSSRQICSKNSLIEGYACSIKHYVRGESGIYYDDLFDLVACLPKCVPLPQRGSLLRRAYSRFSLRRYSFPSSIEGANGDIDSLTGLWRSPNPDGSVSIPIDEMATLSSASPENILQASTSTANSSQLDFEKPTTTKKVRLTPGHNREFPPFV